jgi:hypothetical protein
MHAVYIAVRERRRVGVRRHRRKNTRRATQIAANPTIHPLRRTHAGLSQPFPLVRLEATDDEQPSLEANACSVINPSIHGSTAARQGEERRNVSRARPSGAMTDPAAPSGEASWRSGGRGP